MDSLNNLFKKFHEGTLTMEELAELRHHVNLMSDEEISHQISSSALDADMTTVPLDRRHIDEMYQRLMRDAMSERRRTKVYRYVAWAAAVAIPLMLIAGIFMTMRLHQLDRYTGVIAAEHVITTGIGEEMLSVLPDGTRVQMAPQSELRYTLSHFNDLERQVDWVGQGTFEVTRNEKSPFIVATPDFKVRVLGTVFTLDAYRDSERASVYLKSGSVSLSAKGDTCVLYPGDMATVDHRSGTIAVKHTPENEDDFGSASLLFYDRPISEVAARVGRYYGIKIYLPKEVAMQHFAGAIPKHNVDEAIIILGKASGLTPHREGNVVNLR